MAAGACLLDFLDHSQAEGHVVVLAIDDLQWVDRPSLRAVLFALRRLRADRVLTIVATRTGELADTGWARFVAGDARVTRVHLDGLSSIELIEMAKTLGLGALSHGGASRLIAHTKGNALYCRALLDEIGVIRLNAEEGALPAPRDLSAVILTRVSGLSASTQGFLAAAAVLGQHAPLSRIGAVAEMSDARDEVDAAVGAGLLIEGPLSELSFVHPLYRAAIYADLSPTNRRSLHARAAGLLTGRPQLAHRVAASVGPDGSLAAELEELAVSRAAAGDAGASAWALEQSASLSPLEQDRERRILDAAVLHLNAADTSAAARALASCQVSSPRRDALMGLVDVFTGSPHAESRLLAAWRSHDPVEEREVGARAATSLANWMVISGRPTEALTWADLAVEATTSDSTLRAMAQTAQAYAFAAAGRSPEGLEVLGFLPASANEVSMSDLDVLIMRGILKLYVDDLPGAIRDLGIAASRLRTGLPSTYPGPCLSHLSDAYFRRGDWDAAVTYAQLATSFAQDADRPLDLARAHARAAQVLGLRGQWTAARTHFDALGAATERFPLVVAVASSAVAGASIAFAHGDLPGVLVATERVRATGLLGVGGCPGIFNWRGMEIDALIGLGRFADAAEALEELEAAIPPSGVPSADLTLARCRGNLAGAVGEASEAGSYFARAHQLKVDVPMPFEHALVSLDDGRRLCSVENRPSAVEQLERAHRIFSDLGADPFVQACSSGLASLQVTNAPDSPSAILALSRSEMAVARLVATGLTNREVANELYVSVKTVEYHLRNSYIKLNITSRRELAALLP